MQRNPNPRTRGPVRQWTETERQVVLKLWTALKPFCFWVRCREIMAILGRTPASVTWQINSMGLAARTPNMSTRAVASLARGEHQGWTGTLDAFLDADPHLLAETYLERAGEPGWPVRDGRTD